MPCITNQVCQKPKWAKNLHEYDFAEHHLAGVDHCYDSWGFKEDVYE